MLTIFTDSDTDISLKEANEYGLKLISMPYIIGDTAYYPYKNEDSFDFKPFYDLLRSGTIPTTCALSPQEYLDYFEQEFAAGNDILYIHFSAAMTATFQFMDEALKDLKERYPERKFYQIDTKAITIGSYNAVKEIMDYYKQGKSVEEVIEYAKNEVDHYATYFFADDLKFFKRSGRVSGIAATMGTIIGIKPIIYIDENGVMKSLSKAKGRKGALAKLVEYVETLGDDIANHHVIVGHTDSEDVAHQLGDMLVTKFGPLNIEYVYVNPTAGSHCGPSGVGVSFHAKHR